MWSFTNKMKRKNQREKTIKELVPKDDELLQITTTIEGSLG